jgi:UTP--glucose-1-phosphate uridylyltransferase
VHFAKEVVLRGTVIVVASDGARIDIPRGSVLENAVVTGNLRILEH